MTDPVKLGKLPQMEDRPMKYKCLEKQAKEVVLYAKKEKGIIVTCVDGYITDKEALHLRDMLWFARDNGVAVEFAPKEKENVH